MAEHDYTAVLLEEIRNKIETVAGAVNVVGDRVERMDKRLEHVETQVQLLPVLQTAVTDISRQLTKHDQRLNRVEGHTELLPAIQSDVKAQSAELADYAKRVFALERAA
jgi:DNA repair ATPase RecN